MYTKEIKEYIKEVESLETTSFILWDNYYDNDGYNDEKWEPLIEEVNNMRMHCRSCEQILTRLLKEMDE